MEESIPTIIIFILGLIGATIVAACGMVILQFIAIIIMIVVGILQTIGQFLRQVFRGVVSFLKGLWIASVWVYRTVVRGIRYWRTFRARRQSAQLIEVRKRPFEIKERGCVELQEDSFEQIM